MQILWRFARVLSLVLFAALGTSILTYTAPGYFSDVRELDAQHAAVTRGSLDQLRRDQHALGPFLQAELQRWRHGDLGVSRQFGTPVATLLRQRSWSSAQLLLVSMGFGWSAALFLAVPLSMGRSAAMDTAMTLLTVTLLAVPVGGLAMISLLANVERPAWVLASLIAVRDFRVLHRSLRSLWAEPYLLQARASGVSARGLLTGHVFPSIRRELLSVGVMSFTLALSALIPVEVVFDRQGLGQLAWGAAMNRDAPVLVAVTFLLAVCVGIAGFSLEQLRGTDELECAQ